mgnify:CR=1 FL=1
MSEVDNLIARLYPEKQDPPLDQLWKRFHTNPNMSVYSSSGIKQAFHDGDCSNLLNRFRMGFFPDMGDGAIEREIILAMNQGINALNSLCEDYLGDVDFDFSVNPLGEQTSLFDFLMRGREQWISGKDNHVEEFRKHSLLLSAYKKARAYDMGKRILHVNGDFQVLASVRNYESCLNWFQSLLGFERREEANVNGHNSSWSTNAGVELYGDDAPMRSRVKVLYPDERLKYSSLLMKLCLEDEDKYLEDIDDLTGFEFIVEDDLTRKKFIEYIKHNSTPTATLRGYKDRTRAKADNPMSSKRFTNISFTLYVPVPLDHMGLGISRAYGRLPVEVQILTLGEDKIRNEDSDALHESYKRRSFARVFPAWFPRQIYEPLICNSK